MTCVPEFKWISYGIGHPKSLSCKRFIEGKHAAILVRVWNVTVMLLGGFWLHNENFPKRRAWQPREVCSFYYYSRHYCRHPFIIRSQTSYKIFKKFAGFTDKILDLVIKFYPGGVSPFCPFPKGVHFSVTTIYSSNLGTLYRAKFREPELSTN